MTYGSYKEPVTDLTNPVMHQMYPEVKRPHLSKLLLVVCFIQIALALPGKFIPVKPAGTLADQPRLSGDVLHKIQMFKEMLAKRGNRKLKVEATDNIATLEVPGSDKIIPTDLDDTDETIAKIEKKKKRMRKEWKKFKKWRRKKRKRKKMRNRIIQMITRKLEGKLQQAGINLNDKNLKKIFDIN